MFLLEVLMSLIILFGIIGLIVWFLIQGNKLLSTLGKQLKPFSLEAYSNNIRVISSIVSLIYGLILYYIVTEPGQAGIGILLAHLCLLTLFFLVKKTDLTRQQGVLVALSLVSGIRFTIYTTAYIENRLHIMAFVTHVSLFSSLFVSQGYAPGRAFLGFFLYLGRTRGIVSTLGKTPTQHLTDKVSMTKHVVSIFLGILGLVVIGGIALSLLMSADPIFATYADQVKDFLFGHIDRWEVIGVLIFMLLVAPVVLGAVTWSGQNSRIDYSKTQKLREIPIVTIAIVMGGLLSLYVLFLIVQANYLFAPNHEMIIAMEIDSYASYVHRGISEIILVVLLNLALIALVHKTKAYHTSKKHGLTWMMFALVLLTIGLAGSSAFRLVEYIGSYGLTHERIFLLWGIGFGMLTLLYIALKIKDMTKLFLDTWILMVGGGSLLAMGFINIDAVIARHNIDRIMTIAQHTDDTVDTESSFKVSQHLDYYHLFEDVSPDAIVQQLRLIQDPEQRPPAYALQYALDACHDYYQGSFLYYKRGMARGCRMLNDELDALDTLDDTDINESE